MDRSRGGGGSGFGSSRGSTAGRGRGGSNSQREDKPKKESILDLSKYQDKQVRVKFAGGREVVGLLKGYDPLLNLVMDDVEEYIRDPDTGVSSSTTRKLGLVVIRGPSLVLISPVDGSEEISNPFMQNEE